MSKFKYIGANAKSFAGKNVAICFNDGTITIDEDHTCVCPPALQKALDAHPDFERLMQPAEQQAKETQKPKAEATEIKVEQPEPVEKPKAKPEPKKPVAKPEAKKTETKPETTTRRRRTRKASK